MTRIRAWAKIRAKARVRDKARVSARAKIRARARIKARATIRAGARIRVRELAQSSRLGLELGQGLNWLLDLPRAGSCTCSDHTRYIVLCVCLYVCICAYLP